MSVTQPHPPLGEKAFASDPDLQEAFVQLTKGKQREYADYIGDAKQMKTRINRLRKIMPMIKSGVGLNDHYK